ncbi:MAG: signal recognition particle protein [Chlamydiae bacterium GWC2_50_10]|nr:MAG: signal recognition particle protein [Chlamydiae bacterium GWA2_50_15]OGN54970.1 MAG: signal recognition particle protein [Chlamydiae bacterium GWC2_50_10]OGN58703.1 MAG: signal recognition particle protein [Chlamydiae bacterium RIFCSPHIGHO2_02_FULL_49_29]OGN63096.1 MAG: signal recognition particle protein [Chlamydiae bacterium RIFCSPHIGHO2_12_FULL_49_32]OGN68747.1 MAG: signal recognition particle protein [Chlamydiae bacterium RIFCSPLOWO2_02_FULL_49_12]OGN72123.1 MAG: signal recognition
MFGTITEKFQSLFASLSGTKKLSEENIAQAVREVRLALLDADVHYGVVSQFVKRVKERALGVEVLKALKPSEHFIEIVHQELVSLMGSEPPLLHLSRTPAVIVLCGLQGSGKTTQCAKLAHYFQGNEQKKRVLVAACDLQRPAAIDQLKTLCAAISVPVFSLGGQSDPLLVATEALERAKKEAFDILIVDTAGRLHADEALMAELKEIKRALNPQEVFFVASAATGQDAVKTAQEFDQKIGISGSILTMLDGSARAGAALSISQVTKKPLFFEGVGEKIGDLQPFNPRSMADRILGMGDVINLVRKAKEQMDEEEEKKLEKKLKNATFTYQDYLQQMKMVKKMGSFKSLFKMLPGASKFSELEHSDQEFGKMEAMILSMTPEERSERVDLIFPRRWRVAKGSGTSVDDVNRMVKGFKNLKQMMKQMNKGKFNKEKLLWR